MTCSRCGKAATTKRGEVLFCGVCSIAVDFQVLIAMIQDTPIERGTGRSPLARSA